VTYPVRFIWVRRLFSTFATGLPGLGLLIMRLVAGGVLVYRGVGGLIGVLSIGPTPVLVAKIALGSLLIAGLWTPVAGVLVAALEIGIFVLQSEDPWLHLLLATLGISLALLGPGVWSVDARRFGWKRINIGDRQSRSRSD
jgi:putative oxidoreductase